MEKYRPLQELGIDIQNGIIPLVGDVDQNMHSRLVTCLNALSNANIGYNELIILLNTHGGEVDQAFAIYDLLKNQEMPIRVICNGPVLSAGTIILMAGDKREMTKHSYLLFHYGEEGNTCVNDKRHANYINKCYNNLFINTKVTENMLKTWANTNVYYNPEQALELNLITGIINYDKKKRNKKSAN